MKRYIIEIVGNKPGGEEFYANFFMGFSDIGKATEYAESYTKQKLVYVEFLKIEEVDDARQ